MLAPKTARTAASPVKNAHVTVTDGNVAHALIAPICANRVIPMSHANHVKPNPGTTSRRWTAPPQKVQTEIRPQVLSMKRNQLLKT